MKEYILSLKEKPQHNVGFPTLIFPPSSTYVLLMTHF